MNFIVHTTNNFYFSAPTPEPEPEPRLPLLGIPPSGPQMGGASMRAVGTWNISYTDPDTGRNYGGGR